MERSGSLCGRVAAARETLHGRQCSSIGKMLLAGAPWRNCWYGQPADAAAGITGSKKQHREEGAMAKVPGSYVKFGKECTFAA